MISNLSDLGVNIPSGFVVTANAYDLFMNYLFFYEFFMNFYVFYGFL